MSRRLGFKMKATFRWGDRIWYIGAPYAIQLTIVGWVAVCPVDDVAMVGRDKDGRPCCGVCGQLADSLSVGDENWPVPR
jgi:hypothetical protein